MILPGLSQSRSGQQFEEFVAEAVHGPVSKGRVEGLSRVVTSGQSLNVTPQGLGQRQNLNPVRLLRANGHLARVQVQICPGKRLDIPKSQTRINAEKNRGLPVLADHGEQLLEFRDGRSEEHTSELQSLRHLVC